MSKILVIGALPESLINFRGEFLHSLVSAGHTVIAFASEAPAEVSAALKGLGVSLRSFPIDRTGLNPLNDLRTFLALRGHFRHLSPDIVFSYTIKPVIWSGMALKGIPEIKFFALITGLGFAFQETNPYRKLLAKVVSTLYRISLSNASAVIFQNRDNRACFISRRIVHPGLCAVVNGSGVNLDTFSPAPLPGNGTVFLMIGRLLKEKGFREYAKAARIVRQRHPECEFRILGPRDPSPDAISTAEIQEWEGEGIVKYLGAASDVRPHIRGCHIFVLPSYHEGMPRTVLEAMAIGRPILTTDTPGCRETVIPGENGFLVPSANAEALAERMCWLIENRSIWQRMGEQSRLLAANHFDVRLVNTELLKIMGL